MAETVGELAWVFGVPHDEVGAQPGGQRAAVGQPQRARGVRGDAELQTRLIGLGARFLIAGSDTSYLDAAMRKDVQTLRAALTSA